MPAPLDPALAAAVAKAPRWPVASLPVSAEKMPRHVAIIMDGNGRWATQQGKIRVTGHQAGVHSVRAVTKYGGQVGLKALTLYAFSTENWKRPQAEIRFLFRLLRKYLIEERAELIANGVRLTSIGSIERLPDDVRAELQATERLTAENKGLNLCLALSYGAQDEILAAARTLVAQAADGKLDPAAITEEKLESALFTAGMPPVDLLIRTAGERRLSNFLLWQADGAEFQTTQVCWPEFEAADLEAAIIEYGNGRVPGSGVRVPGTETKN